MEFHAHIYFDPAKGPESRESVVGIRDYFLGSGLPGLHVGPIEDLLRGPHQLPMFELVFDGEAFQEISLWLLLNRGEHTVLIHAVTGNDPVDHDRHAFWLGQPLELDTSKLDPPHPGWTPPHAVSKPLSSRV